MLLTDDTIDLKTMLSHIPEELRKGPEEAFHDALSPPQGEEEKHLKALQATIDLGNGQTHTAVVLPADHRYTQTCVIAIMLEIGQRSPA